MTVREPVVRSENAKVPKAEIAKRAERVAEVLQIEPLLRSPVRCLVGNKRVGYRRARADVDVLFDEPPSNLMLPRTDLRVELKRLHQQLKTP
jgi:ABC-type sugar transport system ATPase subunit